MAVTNDAIERNTAVALGLERGDFKVSNRVDDGVRSSYVVATKAGRKYNCYVGGSVSVIGRVVTDAICTEIGKSASSTTSPNTTCNALLKAAGKC